MRTRAVSQLIFDGVEIEVDAAAVIVRARWPLSVVSSAVVGGGLARARGIVNLHVPKAFDSEDPGGALEAFVDDRAIPRPYVGLMTAARTEMAETALETADGLTAAVIATVGLGNPVTAGGSARAIPVPSTINTIVVVDAAPEPAAMVNAVMTCTEVKTALLRDAGIRCPDGRPATGTSTDAVVIAATGRGVRCTFGGPISDFGWVVARATRAALDQGIRHWAQEHG